jgi:Mg/Co/Ni transporter MgtE
MDNDEIVDLLDELEGEEREKVLFNLEKEDAQEVNELLKYENESVGSMMSKDFIAFRLSVTVEETIDILKEMEPDEDVMFYIYVTDEEGRIEGLVILRDLLLSDGSTTLKEIMEENITRVRHDDPIAEAIEQASKYDLLSTAVVDEEGRLVGIVKIHDIIDEVLYPLWKKKNRTRNQ